MEVFWFIVASLGAGLIGLLTYIYHLKKGGFDDIEESKYHPFWDDDEK